MIQTIARGGDITLDVAFENGAGQLDDADPVLIDIINPSDIEVVSNASPTTNPSTGLYSYTYAVPEDAPLGIWFIRWAGVVDSAPTTPATEAFEVVATGQAVVPSTTYATLEDFETRKGDVPDEDEEKVSALLDDASALIAAAIAGSTLDWVTGLAVAPAAVKAICVEVAYRAWSNPDAASQITHADSSLSYTRNGIADALFLTPSEKRVVRGAAGTSASVSVELVSPYSGDSDDWPELVLD